MTYDIGNPGLGHNTGASPDLIADIDRTFSPIRLAEDHAALALDVQMLTEHAGRLTVVNSPETREAAADITNKLRDLEARVDNAAEDVKKPVYDAYKNVLAFFGGLNNSDTKRNPGPLTRHKVRIGILVRDDALAVAAEQKRIAEEAAKEQRERAQREADAAAEQERLKRTAVADVLMGEAVKSEEVAQVLEARAEGPVQDLARTRSEAGTLGLRGNPTFAVTDPAALRASLGTLGDHLSAPHIEQAIRSWQAAMMKAQRMKQADEIVGAKRALTPDVAIPGVEFFVLFSGNVR